LNPLLFKIAFVAYDALKPQIRHGFQRNW